MLEDLGIRLEERKKMVLQRNRAKRALRKISRVEKKISSAELLRGKKYFACSCMHGLNLPTPPLPPQKSNSSLLSAFRLEIWLIEKIAWRRNIQHRQEFEGFEPAYVNLF